MYGPQRKSLYLVMIILRGNREIASADNLKKEKKRKNLKERERRWLGKLGELKVVSGYRG